MIKINVKKDNIVILMLLTNLIAVALLLVGCGVFTLVQKDASGYLTQRVSKCFSDFSVIMKCALMDNPYSSEICASYPPIAIFILYLPALISKSIIHMDNVDMIKHPLFWLSFVLFFGAFLAASVPLFKRITGFRGKKLAMFCGMFLLSGPLIYNLERGNVITAALFFSLVFFAFYKSDNKVLRELALVGLALAGAVKIYPLLLGVLLLRDKRYFCSVRVALYFTILFFLPFLFFDGGFSNVRIFVKNLGGFSMSDRLMGTRNMSTIGLIHKLFYTFEHFFDVSLTTPSHIVSTTAIAILSVLSVFAALVARDRFRVLLICALVIAIISPISYYYCTLFLIIPFFDYIANYDKTEENRRTFYLLFFSAVAGIILRAIPMLLGIILTIVLVYEIVIELRQFFSRMKSHGTKEKSCNQ